MWWYTSAASCWSALLPPPRSVSGLQKLGDKNLGQTIPVQKGGAGLLPDLGLPTCTSPSFARDSSRRFSRPAIPTRAATSRPVLPPPGGLVLLAARRPG